jgi:hypothetical protein
MASDSVAAAITPKMAALTNFFIVDPPVVDGSFPIDPH